MKKQLDALVSEGFAAFAVFKADTGSLEVRGANLGPKEAQGPGRCMHRPYNAGHGRTMARPYN